MQIDQEILRWVITGLSVVGGTLITWLLSRQVSQIDKALDDHDERIEANRDRITVIERDYVRSDELDKTFRLYLAPINVELAAINKKLDKSQ